MRVEFRFTSKHVIEIDAEQLFDPKTIKQSLVPADILGAFENATKYCSGLLTYSSNFSAASIINLALVRSIRIIK